MEGAEVEEEDEAFAAAVDERRARYDFANGEDDVTEEEEAEEEGEETTCDVIGEGIGKFCCSELLANFFW